MTPSARVQRNGLKPRVRLREPQDSVRQSTPFLAESVEHRLHAMRRETTRPGSRSRPPRTATPCPLSCLAAGEPALDNNYRADYCIPSMPRLVHSEAVRQSIHEREDAHPDAQDRVDLPRRGVLLFLTWQPSFADR